MLYLLGLGMFSSFSVSAILCGLKPLARISNILFTTAPGDQLENSREFTHSFKHAELAYQEQTPLPPYRLTYLDFGMMGRLTPVMADGIAEVVLALTSKDQHRIAQAVLGICNQTGELDQQRFSKELSNFIRPYLAEGLGQIDFSNMLYRIIQLCEDNNLQIKPEVTMLIKAFGTLESTVAHLDPDISMMAVARSKSKLTGFRRLNQVL